MTEEKEHSMLKMLGVPDEYARKVVRRAETMHVSVAAVIRWAIMAYFNRNGDSDENRTRR